MVLRQEVADAVNQLRPLPRVVMRLVELLESDTATTEQIEAVIVADPVMCGRVLQVANSAYYGLARQVSTVQHALLVLGSRTVRGIALSVAAVDAFRAHRSVSAAERDLWRHAFSTALCARGIALTLRWGVSLAEDAYIVGLLHDIGALFLRTRYRALYQPLMAIANETERLEREVQIFGCDHADVGAMIADHWRLPERIVQAIAHHHAPYLPDGENRRLMAAVLQAEAWQHGGGAPAEVAVLIRLSEQEQAQMMAQAQEQTALYEQMLFS
ncbi:MAG: HDOD domain-containing protein [bacterium]|nr:HDOD domain-containing protein [bacterium]